MRLVYAAGGRSAKSKLRTCNAFVSLSRWVRSVTDIGLVYDPRQAGSKRDLWPLQERKNSSIRVKMYIQT